MKKLLLATLLNFTFISLASAGSAEDRILRLIFIASQEPIENVLTSEEISTARIEVVHAAHTGQPDAVNAIRWARENNNRIAYLAPLSSDPKKNLENPS
ncbi:MAG: hypothetical protein V7711_01965 [Pseudomonadales bacterium]